MKRIIIVSIALIFSLSTFAGGYRILAHVEGLKDTTLLLGYYFGDKKYVVDTAHLDSKGNGIFEGKKLLDPGVYLVLTPTYKYFEIVLDKDQEFEFSTDTINLFKKIVFKGSDDNEIFNKYQLFSAEMQGARKPLWDKYKENAILRDSAGIPEKQKEASKAEIEKIKEELKVYDDKTRVYEDGIIAQNPTGVLSLVLLAMREIEIPDYPRDDKGNITDSLFKYHYMTNHYFDNVNFSQKALLRTPVFQPKIDNYLDKEIPQIPDTIIVEVDKIITKAEANPEIYKFIVHHLFMKYQNPKLMGLDNIFVHIAEKYYLSGKATWATEDTAFMSKVKDRYEKMRYNRVGYPNMDMTVFNIGYFWQKVNSIKADYTVIYFYEPGCGHCQKTIPAWHNMFRENKLKEKGVECVLFYTQADTVEWRKFLDKHDLYDFVNVFDPYQNTNFRTFYDIYSTPVSYVLDRNKKIIAKRIPPETIVELLNRRFEIDALEKKKAAGK